MKEQKTDKDTVGEKEKFFKTINDFIVTSGVVAAGIKAVTNGISNQVRETRRGAEKKAIFAGLTAIGLVFAFIGAVQVITHFFDLALYTNLIIGGIFLLGAILVKIIR